MIKIDKLYKTYEAKRTKCEALRGVSFVLPEKGLVFVLGKSGSGKSTLLNLLGGLDAPTSGDIIVDGKKFSEFSVKDFDNFRNEKLGFIFQDFCLLDELTVEENIRLILNLRAEDNPDIISETLNAVGLDGLEKRYPKELSAGQKQRVAIARALVKKPKLILADEPTGNIDSKTAQAVLDILKTLSSERLVVVISHNNDDAIKYADRIIEIADGQIIRDETRKENYEDKLEFDLPEIVLPYNKKLTADEVKKLNAVVSERHGEVYIDQNDSGFLPTVQPPETDSLGEYKNKAMSGKSLFTYSAMFFKKRWLNSTFSIILITFLMIVFGLAQLFTMFDGEAQLRATVAKQGDRGMIFKQGYYLEDDIERKVQTSRLKPISEENENALREVYGNGKIYRMYSLMLPISRKTFRTEHKYELTVRGNFSKGPATETNGVLVCDIDYLKHLYGDENGEIKVLAGSIDDTRDGVIVTDYVADSFLYYQDKHFESYDDLITGGFIESRVRIAAVIDSGYKQRYKSLVDEVTSNNKINWKNELVYDFVDEAMNYLTVMFTFNQNYVEDYLDWYCAQDSDGLFTTYDYALFDEGLTTAELTDTFGYFSAGLGADEMRLGLVAYNVLMDTEFTDDDLERLNTEKPFDGMSITLRLATDDNAEYYFEHTFNVVEIIETGSCQISKEYLRDAKAKSIVNTALYFENSDKGVAVAARGDELAMYPVGYRFKLIRQIINIVTIFDDVFFYIGIALCLAIGIMLAINSLNNIKQNAYEIGVIRAMGGRTGQLGGIFAIQTVFTGLIIAALTAIGNFLGVMLFNNVLIEGISKVVKAPGIEDLTILIYNPYIVLIDVGLVLLLTVISVVVPILAVRKIQPIKIIRARE